MIENASNQPTEQQKDKDIYYIDQVVSNKYVINIDEDIAEEIKYREIFKIIENATENDIVQFNIACNGGNVDTTVIFVNLLRKTKAKTIANLYRAYSAEE